MNNPKPMRHIPSVRLLRTSRVVAWTVATFDLFLLSAGFRVGPCWHVVGRRQLGCIDSPLVRGCSGGSSRSAATMCAEEGVPTIRTKSADMAEVALTREAGKNKKLASRLEEAGVSCVEIPCIRHQDGPDLPLLPTALEDRDLAYVVITSPEAAKVFISGWKGAGQPAVPVACVGKATSETLEKSGIEPVFTPSKATGETLAAELPFPDEYAGVEPRPRVLYPASARAQMTLESRLVARGFHVQRLNTYDTVPAEWDASAEAAAMAASVVAFGSPSAVKTWAVRAGVARETIFERKEAAGGPREGITRAGALAACIGETSARACREAGWAESAIFYPEKPGMEGWARAILDAVAVAKASSGAAV
ncbi:unnamed protein product [Ascophyllum nodosum]